MTEMDNSGSTVVTGAATHQPTAAPLFALPEGTHTVSFGLGDLNGIMRGKRIPASHFEIC